ncbi:hypothetical protein [Mucilaginibacter sp.]|jgi:hypothetical protein|uniref:hypothetical protein n=1 Tax=Mucilaginibacter sp. TaxID=1882438 RepID=UPI0035684139
MRTNPLQRITLSLALLVLLMMSCKTENLLALKPGTTTLRTENAPGQFIVTPRKASDYINSIGVNIHMRFTAYKNNFDNIIFPKLKTLGIKNIRDGVPYKGFLNASDTAIIKNRFIKLYDSLGIKVTYALDSKKLFDSVALRNSAYYLSVFRTSAKLRQTIQTLEGFNEPDLTIYTWDTTPSKSQWAQITYDIQKGLYTGAHTGSDFAGIPVVSTSLTAYWQNRPPLVAAITPHISTYFDYANFHCYDAGNVNWKMFPATYYDLTKSFFPTIQQGKPYMITETGYENARYWNVPGSPGYLQSSYHYLSELSSGKYYSVLFMEQMKRGAARVYAYEFLDQNTSDQTSSENNFGLIHTDGTVKPAFTAIKNTIDLLKDVNTAFTPTPLTYMMSGDTTNIRTYLFQKTDGRYYLALWQGQPSGVNYDFPNFQDLPADTQNISITFTQPFATAKTYKPMESANPITSGINIVTMNLAVPDQLLIIELKP